MRPGVRAGLRTAVRMGRDLGVRQFGHQRAGDAVRLAVKRRERDVVELAAVDHDRIVAIEALDGADAVALGIGDLRAGADLFAGRGGKLGRVDRTVDGAVGAIDAIAELAGDVADGVADRAGADLRRRVDRPPIFQCVLAGLPVGSAPTSLLSVAIRIRAALASRSGCAWICASKVASSLRLAPRRRHPYLSA